MSGDARDRRTVQLGSMGTEYTLIGAINVLLRHRRLVVFSSLILFAFVVLHTARGSRRYTSTSSFVFQTQQVPSSISGLAAQLGVSVPTGDASRSPDFAAEILRSRFMLERLMESEFSLLDGQDTIRGPLIDFYDIRDKSSAKRRDNLLRRLRREVVTATSNKTSIVSLSVSTEIPELSKAINQRLLELFHEFNVNRRQSQASAERRFAAEREADVGSELREAENSLLAFLESNRDFRSSPQLTFEHERLRRQVAFQQQIHTTVAQVHEQAKIEEVRDTPIVTILDRPEIALNPDARGLVVRGVLAFFIGGILGYMLAFGIELGRNSKGEESDEFAELQRLATETVDDVRHPIRSLRRARAQSHSGTAD